MRLAFTLMIHLLLPCMQPMLTALPCSFAVLLASIPALSNGELAALVRRLPRNPEVLQAALALLEPYPFGLAEQYLEPANGYSDAVRLAVVAAFPAAGELTLPVFRCLRLGLVDDDEEVRLTARARCAALLGAGELSVPATLEELHRRLASASRAEYLEWREAALAPASPAEVPPAEEVLFAAEPPNLFCSPAWELAIEV